MSNIQIVKFLNGEEVLCDLEYKDGKYTLNKPLSLVVIPPQGPGQQPSVLLMSWMPYADTSKSVEVEKAAVSFKVPPTAQLKSKYMEATSGIVTPPKGLIVPN